MKTYFLRGTGLLAGLAAFGLVWSVCTKAQPAGSASKPVNWLGSVVVGKNDVTDNIAHSPYPTVMQQIELGLRSDGVVVWRDLPAK